MKPIKFSWVVWGLGLLAAVLLGSFSSVNSDGVDGFFQSVGVAFERGDVLLILCAVVTLALLAWLLLALATGSFQDKANLNKRG